MNFAALTDPPKEWPYAPELREYAAALKVYRAFFKAAHGLAECEGRILDALRFEKTARADGLAKSIDRAVLALDDIVARLEGLARQPLPFSSAPHRAALLAAIKKPDGARLQ